DVGQEGAVSVAYRDRKISKHEERVRIADLDGRGSFALELPTRDDVGIPRRAPAACDPVGRNESSVSDNLDWAMRHISECLVTPHVDRCTPDAVPVNRPASPREVEHEEGCVRASVH